MTNEEIEEAVRRVGPQLADSALQPTAGNQPDVAIAPPLPPKGILNIMISLCVLQEGRYKPVCVYCRSGGINQSVCTAGVEV